MKYRHYLIDRYGRPHRNIRDIFSWARNDYGYPQIQEWETGDRYIGYYFITQGAMQSKVLKGLCEKV
jgi:hypothetical protein